MIRHRTDRHHQRAPYQNYPLHSRHLPLTVMRRCSTDLQGQGSQQAKTRQDQARRAKTALKPVLSRLGLVFIKPLDKRLSRLPHLPYHAVAARCSAWMYQNNEFDYPITIVPNFALEDVENVTKLKFANSLCSSLQRSSMRMPFNASCKTRAQPSAPRTPVLYTANAYKATSRHPVKR